MNPYPHRYLITGQPRGLLADALVEYRQYAREHPGDPLSIELLRVAREVHLALHEEREVLRQIGETGKPNAHCPHVSAAERYRRRQERRARLQREAA